MRKVVTAGVIAAAVCVAVTACQAPSKADEIAPTNALTVPKTSISTAVPVPTVPVELSGSGESVLTANLEPGGYTVQYTNTSGHMIVKPVNRDGTKGSSFINTSETSGVTAYASTGPVTLQIENTRGPWTLRFVPLA
ncbi:hypothetical protein [Prescottella equi]|uniref:hypothetical protein n=1 Tax=Rhodococcus hoagii TaxID=43767 RepID=UPI00111C835E|nr:hypothetical protein [Prescottella equi]